MINVINHILGKNILNFVIKKIKIRFENTNIFRKVFLFKRSLFNIFFKGFNKFKIPSKFKKKKLNVLETAENDSSQKHFQA